MMATATQSMISASSCALPSCHKGLSRSDVVKRRNSRIFFSTASANQEDPDCNTEECAPDKEVGKVSMEWLAGEKTKVVGTFPPKRKGWTGYVEKDTAGQTNIYSVEPVVYVAESVISSGNAGSSSDGAENTAAVAAGLALISIAAASSILLQVGKNVPQLQTTEYSGPPLTYYINKFKPVSIVEAAAPIEVQESPSIQADSSASLETPQVQVQLSDLAEQAVAGSSE